LSHEFAPRAARDRHAKCGQENCGSLLNVQRKLPPICFVEGDIVMARFFTFAAAGALAACIGATAWSQTGQSGGTGTAGGAGGAGASGNAGTTGSAGATGTTGQAGASANAGAAGQTGTGQLQTGTNAPGQRQFGSAPFPNNNNNFTGPNRNPFFADPMVRRQLNMNDDQFNRLNQSRQEALTRFDQGIDGLGSNLTPQQRMQRIQQLEAQFNQQFGQSLDTTFTDRQVRTRFNQLNFQFQPFDAFRDPAVRQQLQLTPQQQRQMRTLANQWRQQLQRMRRAGNDIDPTVADQQFAELQLQFQQQMEGLLTPQQRQAWNQLIGERFTFPRSVFFPPDTTFDVNGTANAGVQQQPGTARRQDPQQATQNTNTVR
jgi:hypothetical protein